MSTSSAIDYVTEIYYIFFLDAMDQHLLNMHEFDDYCKMLKVMEKNVSLRLISNVSKFEYFNLRTWKKICNNTTRRKITLGELKMC